MTKNKSVAEEIGAIHAEAELARAQAELEFLRAVVGKCQRCTGALGAARQSARERDFCAVDDVGKLKRLREAPGDRRFFLQALSAVEIKELVRSAGAKDCEMILAAVNDSFRAEIFFEILMPAAALPTMIGLRRPRTRQHDGTHAPQRLVRCMTQPFTVEDVRVADVLRDAGAKLSQRFRDSDTGERYVYFIVDGTVFPDWDTFVVNEKYFETIAKHDPEIKMMLGNGQLIAEPLDEVATRAELLRAHRQDPGRPLPALERAA